MSLLDGISEQLENQFVTDFVALEEDLMDEEDYILEALLSIDDEEALLDADLGEDEDILNFDEEFSNTTDEEEDEEELLSLESILDDDLDGSIPAFESLFKALESSSDEDLLDSDSDIDLDMAVMVDEENLSDDELAYIDSEEGDDDDLDDDF